MGDSSGSGVTSGGFAGGGTVSAHPPHVSWEDGVKRGLQGLGRVAPDVTGRLALEMLARPKRRALTPEDLALRGDAAEEAVPFRDITLRAYVWGPTGPANGRTALLVHGWGANATSRTGALVPPLRAAGWRVVSFDAPAHGRSGGVRTDLFDYGQAVREVNCRFGHADTVVAHSFGAAATVWLLAHQPDEALRRLVLFNPPSDFAYMVSVFAGRFDLSEDVVQSLDRAFARRYGMPPDAVSVRSVARLVRVPALIVHDRDDQMVAYREGAALAAAWPAATLLTTDGLGHSGTLRDPDVQRRVLAFLD